MNNISIFIWIIQIYLAGFFFKPALMKLNARPEKLTQMGLIPNNGNPLPIRVLAILELLGCFGIILPWALKILPILTPISALGFVLVMVGAIVFNLKKKSYNSIIKLGTALVLSLVVAWYRFHELGIL